MGSAGGSIDMFNLQSGIHRQRFPPGVNSTRERRPRPHQVDGLEQAGWSQTNSQMNHGKHTNAVTGLMVDNLNTIVISCGLDGKVKVCLAVICVPVLIFLTMFSSGISYQAG